MVAKKKVEKKVIFKSLNNMVSEFVYKDTHFRIQSGSSFTVPEKEKEAVENTLKNQGSWLLIEK